MITIDTTATILNKLPESNFMTLLTGVIVNPFGPTISGFLVQNENEHEGNIIQFMMNPFNKSIKKIGYCNMENTKETLDDMVMLMSKNELNSCPTIIACSKLFSENEANLYSALWVSMFSDSKQTYSRVKKFYGDPWTRISMEINSVFEKPSIFEKIFKRNNSKLDFESSKKYISMIMQNKHFNEEIKALFIAWNGAINEMDIPETVKVSAISVETIIPLFSSIFVNSNASQLLENWESV